MLHTKPCNTRYKCFLYSWWGNVLKECARNWRHLFDTFSSHGFPAQSDFHSNERDLIQFTRSYHIWSKQCLIISSIYLSVHQQSPFQFFKNMTYSLYDQHFKKLKDTENDTLNAFYRKRFWVISLKNEWMIDS